MIKSLVRPFLYPLKRHLKARQRAISSEGFQSIRSSIETHYHRGWRARDKYSPAAYLADLNAHLDQRLVLDRRTVVPWLDAAKPLLGSRIIELGGGTGSSTVALAEQGAEVTAVDLDEDAQIVARDRCAAYGVSAHIVAGNAEDQDYSRYDVAIFFACLEHMTIKERLASLKRSWSMLPSGAHLVVAKAPNRLWYNDTHTSALPCFNWLPDELAFHYTRFSPIEILRYEELTPDSMEHFLRRGRGVSFHEFDVAIGKDLKVVSSLQSFRGWRHSLRQSRFDRRFKRILQHVYPGLHPGWFEEYLYICIEKP
jgi:2-polyprenyl-3-methyl-5-hydroxy-6-metoxy-1,4-benzoquinol methylase